MRRLSFLFLTLVMISSIVQLLYLGENERRFQELDRQFQADSVRHEAWTARAGRSGAALVELDRKFAELSRLIDELPIALAAATLSTGSVTNTAAYSAIASIYAHEVAVHDVRQRFDELRRQQAEINEDMAQLRRETLEDLKRAFRERPSRMIAEQLELAVELEEIVRQSAELEIALPCATLSAGSMHTAAVSFIANSYAYRAAEGAVEERFAKHQERSDKHVKELIEDDERFLKRLGLKQKS